MHSAETFQTKFCRAERCAETEFDRKVFWRCLHRHALPVAPVILLFNRRFFSADRELIAGVRHCTDMGGVWNEVREFFINPTHAGWLRKKANIRVSAHRLIQTAKEHLPSSGKPKHLRPEEAG